MPRGSHNQRLSNAEFHAIFERNHGAAEREYYAMPPEPRSPIGSTLDRSCLPGFAVGRRLRSTGGEVL